MFKHYLNTLFIWSFSVFLVIVIVNIVIDPFALFNIINFPSFNAEKPALLQNLRAYKMHELNKIKPQALILGSSRAQLGLSDKHPGFKYQAYNVGLPLATIDEMWDYFSYAQTLAPIKQVVLAVDFFSFNANLKSLSPFQGKGEQKGSGAFATSDKIAALIGWSGLKGSIETVIFNQKYYVKNIALNADPPLPTELSKTKSLFEKNERFYLERKIYKPYPQKDYSFTDTKGKYSSLQTYQKILKACQQNNIECHVVILPVHARQLTLISELGLWKMFEDWKKSLVAETAPFASAISVIDFTGFSDIHTERVPSRHETKQTMQWFIDSAHITPKLGAQILDKILLKDRANDAFGVQLTLDNIDAHLAYLAQQKLLYQNRQMAEVNEIHTLVKSFS